MRTPLLLALVLALSVAGCADSQTATPEQTETTAAPETTEPTDPATVSSNDEEALERVTAAAGNTVEAGTARFELSVEGAADADAEQTQVVTAEGEEDFENRIRLLRFTGQGGELQSVIDDTTVYIELPATEGDDWARIELDKLLDNVGFGGPAGLPFQSPRDNLAALESAVVAAQERGTEDVRGSSATRYDLTIDLEQAAEDAAGEVNQTFDALAETSGVDELDMAVWVNDEDQISRVSYTLDLSQAQDVEVATENAEANVEPTGELTVTVEYYDFGAELDIDVPDEASIVDVDEDAITDALQQQ